MGENQNFQYRPIDTQYQPAPTESAEKEGFFKKLFSKKNLPKISLILIIVGTLVVVSAILWSRGAFSKAKVELNIETPDDISSGAEIVLIVKYQNNNRVALNDAHLIMNYPQGTFSSEGKEIFQDTRSLGTIGKKSQGEETFSVRFLGEKGSMKNLTARLDYKPENINSKFENTASLKTEINNILIGVHIDGSEKAVAGQEISYAVEYENLTDETVNDLRIKLEYPNDFSFKSADPEPKSKTETNLWEIGSLRPNEKKTINLNGVLSGQEMENKVITAHIGRTEDDNFIEYSQSEFVTQISSAPIILTTNIQGISDDCKVDTDQLLTYKIGFKNNTDVVLKELILKARLQDSVFDVKNIDLGGKGFFDSRTNTITWSGTDIKELSLLDVSQSGEVSFAVKIKKNLPIINFNDKNFIAKVIAEIQTLTVPAKFAGTELKFEKELSCKINTQLLLSTKAYYYEPSQSVFNTGPLPPKVDSATTYTVHWLIKNISNDLDGVKVKSSLPQGIAWTNYIINKSNRGQIYYNERTKELVWDVGRVSAGVGLTMSAYELIFQVSITPSINQAGQSPDLVNASTIEGKDAFTGVNLSDSNSAVNISVPDDSRVNSSQKRVIE